MAIEPDISSKERSRLSWGRTSEARLLRPHETAPHVGLVSRVFRNRRRLVEDHRMDL